MNTTTSPIEAMNHFFSLWPNITVDDLSRIMADDCITHEAKCLPYGGAWVGPQGFIDLVTKVQATWENLNVKIESVFANGVDLVAVRVRVSGDAPAGHFDMPVLELWTFRDGKAVEVIPAYFDTNALVKLAKGTRGNYQAVYK